MAQFPYLLGDHHVSNHCIAFRWFLKVEKMMFSNFISRDLVPCMLINIMCEAKKSSNKKLCLIPKLATNQKWFLPHIFVSASEVFSGNNTLAFCWNHVGPSTNNAYAHITNIGGTVLMMAPSRANQLGFFFIASILSLIFLFLPRYQDTQVDN
jgi:hypothetical protein